MANNRLQLNFELETRPERVQFLESYLRGLPFTPTSAELDTMAKYILWGKDTETGLNGRQEGLELETAHGTWDSRKLESYDALIEDPAFNEALLQKESVPLKLVRETFSRSKTRRTAPSYLLPQFEKLWKQIDTLDLQIETWSRAHNTSTSPIRPQLLNSFKPEELQSLQASALQLSSFQILKMKHELVELRREQYLWRDSFVSVAHPHSAPQILMPQSPILDSEISVLPLHLPNDSSLMEKIWNPNRFPIPSDFSQEELQQITKLLWRKENSTDFQIDFRNEDQLYKIWNIKEDLEDQALELEVESTLGEFLKALQVYRGLAKLDPLIDEILEMKARKATNQVIADYINQKYGKNYKPNYISTLYCKKGLAMIARTAQIHREVVENLMFPENFKVCKDCGRTLLLGEENFVRRGRSSDGFSPRCKECEKKKREGGKL